MPQLSITPTFKPKKRSCQELYNIQYKVRWRPNNKKSIGYQIHQKKLKLYTQEKSTVVAEIVFEGYIKNFFLQVYSTITFYSGGLLTKRLYINIKAEFKNIEKLYEKDCDTNNILQELNRMIKKINDAYDKYCDSKESLTQFLPNIKYIHFLSNLNYWLKSNLLDQYLGIKFTKQPNIDHTKTSCWKQHYSPLLKTAEDILEDHEYAEFSKNIEKLSKDLIDWLVDYEKIKVLHDLLDIYKKTEFYKQVSYLTCLPDSVKHSKNHDIAIANTLLQTNKLTFKFTHRSSKKNHPRHIGIVFANIITELKKALQAKKTKILSELFQNYCKICSPSKEQSDSLQKDNYREFEEKLSKLNLDKLIVTAQSELQKANNELKNLQNKYAKKNELEKELKDLKIQSLGMLQSTGSPKKKQKNRQENIRQQLTQMQNEFRNQEPIIKRKITSLTNMLETLKNMSEKKILLDKINKQLKK